MRTLATVDAASLSGVRLSFGGRTVLDGVDVALRPGELVGLLGPNGGGKTTLLRALLGLVRPAAGRIEVLGGPAKAGRRGVGYMPQAAERQARLPVSARDFVACACRTGWGLPLSSRADRQEVAQSLALAGADAYADRPLAALSGGQLQRVRLAQALLHRPRLLLLDEPLASLDPPGQAAIARLLGQLRDTLGCTILCSAHELNPLLPVLDRVLYVAGGRAAIGTVAEVVNGPVLSRLYGSRIEVLRSQGRIFVLDDAGAPGPGPGLDAAAPGRARA